MLSYECIVPAQIALIRTAPSGLWGSPSSGVAAAVRSVLDWCSCCSEKDGLSEDLEGVDKCTFGWTIHYHILKDTHIYSKIDQHLWWWSQGWRSHCQWSGVWCWSLAYPPTGSCPERAQTPAALGHRTPTHQLHIRKHSSKSTYVRQYVPRPCVSTAFWCTRLCRGFNQGHTFVHVVSSDVGNS